MRQKDAICRRCGPVLATTSDAMTKYEETQYTLGCLLTCGLAAPIILYKWIQRDKAARTYHCTKCGAKVK